MKRIKLQDCCVFISDGDHQAPPKSQEGVPFITISNITSDNRLDFNNAMYVPLEYYEKLPEKSKAMKNDILYSVVGSFGKPVLIDENKKFVFQRHIAILRPDTKKIMPEYLYYTMLSSQFYAIADYLAIGAAQRTLSLESLRNIEIELPPLSQQKKIVDVITPIDKKIRGNSVINDYLEEMAKTIFDYWFVQFDFPNENGKPYKSAGGQMSFCNELNREIPLNWDYISIGNITTCLDSARIPLSNQQREKMKGSIPYYGATGVMGYVNRSIFSGDFVLLAEDGSVMDSNGKPILQRESGDVWINNHTHVLQPANGYSCRLLYLLLKDIPVSLIKTGSIQMKINQTNLNNYNVLNIPDVIRKHFINYIEPLDIKIVQIQKENTQLKQLRDWLLPMLMNAQATIED